MISNQTLYIAIIICLVGLLIVLAPVIANNDKVRNFTLDSFNLVLLLFVAIVLFFLDMRVGVVFTILLLSFLSYAKLEGLTFSHPRFYGQKTEPTKYADQFKLPLNEVEHDKEIMHAEHFENQGCGTSKLPSEQFEDAARVPDGTLVDDTVSTEANVDDNTAMISNVGSYMQQLQKDAVTQKLMSENHEYDIVSCRYDMADASQNTTLNGPPLNWNDTYKGESVNGQLFYPLHG